MKLQLFRIGTLRNHVHPALLPSASDMLPVMPFAVIFPALTLPAAIKTISRRGCGRWGSCLARPR
jgi:hypothetical protein